MATGDSNDLLSRVKQLIPNRWFAYVAPIRDALLGGISDGAAACYTFYAYVLSQSRVATSTGIFLDLIAYDFLGRYLLRNGASDAVFLAQIQATILQERVTRAGMFSALKKLTGVAPVIFEPWNTGDAGGWGVASNLAYGQAGAYGNMGLPGQVFIHVPAGSLSDSIPNVGGYGTYPGGYGTASNIEYIGPSQVAGAVISSQIYAVIKTTKPTGVTAWTAIN